MGETDNLSKPERKVSWEEVHEAARELARIIQKSHYEPDCLVGIAVGGLIPLALVAEELDIHDVTTISARSYKNKTQGEVIVGNVPEGIKGKKILLVDEVAETGATLRKISEVLKLQGGELRTATIGVNTATCDFMPDFYALRGDVWLVFPWEENESK